MAAEAKIEGVEIEETERVTTSLKIDPKLWKKVKIAAMERDMKLYELVEKALKKEIGDDGSWKI